MQMRETRPNLLDDTLAVWQQRSRRQLSREDAREIAENISGFFNILAEWSRQEERERCDPKTPGGISA
jgi:hypothetical protein